VDRRHWHASEARSRFRPARVNADDVDFSDKLGGQRSYRTYSSRKKPGGYGNDPEEFGDISDEDDEDVDHKLARLQREVEQVKASLEARKSKETNPLVNSEDDPLSSISKISEALDAVYSERHGGPTGVEADFSRTLQQFGKQTSPKASKRVKKLLKQASPAQEDQKLMQALEIAADFDSRLSFVESALGLTGSTIPDIGDNAAKPIIPTLEHLEQVIEAAAGSPANLDSAHTRTKQLIKDAEKLQKLRVEQNGIEGKATTNGDAPHPVASEDVSKINALYGVLPTIDSLSPSLPLLLERMRTLQLLHASAAGASELLDDIEKRQLEQSEELAQWRNALEKVEQNLGDGQTALADNVQKVGEWVKSLESKADKFS
jgi:nuclear migration protein JNM1